jgi:O-antigen/teichoic acid export membrane protein
LSEKTERFENGHRAGSIHGPKAYVSDSAASFLRAVIVVASSIVTVPFLIRALPASSYSAWILVVSISSYVAMAESGASTAVVRFSVSAKKDEMSELLASALLGVTALGAIPLSIISVLAYTTDIFFAKAPPALHSKIRVALVFCCFNVFFTLWTSVISGYFTAKHRVKVTVFVSMCTLTLGNLAMVGSAIVQRSFVALAAIFGAMGLVNMLGMVLVISRSLPAREIMPWKATRISTRKIAVHCLATGWWSIATLLISGLDLFLVARIDFEAVGAYGIALKILGALFAVLSAGLTPVMAIVARAHARGDSGRVTELFLRISALTSLMLTLAGGILFVSAPVIVRILAGESYIEKTTLIFRVLIVANLVRNTGAVLGIVMVATGEHHKAYLPPAIEAVVNLGFSIFLGHLYGAIGVAIGTLIGAVTTIVLYLVLIFPRFEAFRPKRAHFVKEVVFKSVLVFMPFGVAALLTGKMVGPVVWGSFASFGLSLAVGWSVLAGEEKSNLVRQAHSLWDRQRRAKISG